MNVFGLYSDLMNTLIHQYVHSRVLQNKEYFWWAILTWLELSDTELRSERRRVTMTEGLWSGRSLGRSGQLAEREACSLSGESASVCRTGTDTGMTSGTRLSSLARLAPPTSISLIPRPEPDAEGLQGLCGSYRNATNRMTYMDTSCQKIPRTDRRHA